MKQFLIKYRRTNGSTEDWHGEIAKFIAGIDADPALTGKVGYRCMKARDGEDYFHIATVHDDSGRVALQERAFFKHYTEATKSVSGGSLEVLPLETIAETVAA
jgi:hypothetical protein